MNTITQLTHQAMPYFHAFTHALTSMGLGLEGWVAYDDGA